MSGESRNARSEAQSRADGRYNRSHRLRPWLFRPVRGQDGKEFDCTIEAYHAQKWRVDRSHLLKERADAEGHPKRFLVEVRLATGTRLSKKIPVEPITDTSTTLPDTSANEQS
jgi:hypothetical protein